MLCWFFLYDKGIMTGLGFFFQEDKDTFLQFVKLQVTILSLKALPFFVFSVPSQPGFYITICFYNNCSICSNIKWASIRKEYLLHVSTQLVPVLSGEAEVDPQQGNFTICRKTDTFRKLLLPALVASFYRQFIFFIDDHYSLRCSLQRLQSG